MNLKKSSSEFCYLKTKEVIKKRGKVKVSKVC